MTTPSGEGASGAGSRGVLGTPALRCSQAPPSARATAGLSSLARAGGPCWVSSKKRWINWYAPWALSWLLRGRRTVRVPAKKHRWPSSSSSRSPNSIHRPTIAIIPPTIRARRGTSSRTQMPMARIRPMARMKVLVYRRCGERSTWRTSAPSSRDRGTSVTTRRPSCRPMCITRTVVRSRTSSSSGGWNETPPSASRASSNSSPGRSQTPASPYRPSSCGQRHPSPVFSYPYVA